ncbi:hydrocarbon degradation protein [Marinilabilia sp.]|uniref:OmpP1/FadL family transporter n=1 Tax=Marinilabilia sp. TaxID=2021252 RepID=UPI0025C72709|nr:hydrocarbon degradation protein [Marinilabilia sp.]
MKKYLFFATALLLIHTATNAQTEDHALRFSSQNPTGTARSIGLGGAMGALGGDYSAIGINPAGIAVYRSSEFSFTPSLVFGQTESDYYGTISKDDKFSVPINQVSYVGTSRLMREVDNGLVSTHFGIGYNRTNNFNRKSFIQRDGVKSSLLHSLASNSFGYIPKDLDNFYTGIAYDARLTELIPGSQPNQYMQAFEFINEEGFLELGPVNGVNQMKLITESGYSGLFDLSFGANFSNQFYLGASLGIATLENKVESQHYEQAGDDLYDAYIDYRIDNGYEILDDFYFDEYEHTSGTGLNLKIGAIFKPVNSIRLGASLHTPTYYSMKTEYDTRARANFFDADNYEITSDLGESSYNFRTPLKAVGSFAYIIGTNGLISVDYEYTDYSTMKFKSKNNRINETAQFNSTNDAINDIFRATHNLRFGAEYRILPTLSLRGGYAMFQNPYKQDQNLLNAAGEHYNITGGLGFRSGNMSIDVAYLFNYETYIHSLYYTPELVDEIQEPAEMIAKNHHLAVTLGWRF